MGMSRHDFLYEMRFWEVGRALRGYNRRQYSDWSRVRWMAFNVMSAMPYCNLKKAGIYRPTDLLHLPTDDEARNDVGSISDEEALKMIQMMKSMNRKARRKKTRK